MQIPAPKVLLITASLAGLFLVLHFFPSEWSYIVANRLNLDNEANIPTWYSTVLLFSVAVTAFGIAALDANPLPPTNFWLLLGGVYLFLSMDEGARLHEIIDKVTSIKWVYFYAPFAAAFFMAAARYLMRSGETKLRNLILGGLILTAIGAMAAELIGHAFKLNAMDGVFTQIEVVLEEGCEMFGTILVLYGCLLALNRSLAKLASPS